uniref:(California timema) hypothetical protein n=1 Tax=Timema californicum TaxID=61474 RepID=A0A7R9JFJ6_TIMCA|nr:unnamed protein product [Timema californicum]
MLCLTLEHRSIDVINRFEDIEKDSNVLTEYRNYKVSLKDDSVSSYRFSLAFTED